MHFKGPAIFKGPLAVFASVGCRRSFNPLYPTQVQVSLEYPATVFKQFFRHRLTWLDNVSGAELKYSSSD